MEHNRFLAHAWKGDPDPLRQVMAILLTWAIFILLGGSILMLPVAYLLVSNPAQAEAYLADPMNFKLLGMDPILVFILIMCQFVVGLGGIWATERLLLRKPFRWVVTGYRRCRKGRFLAGLGAWMGLMCLYELAAYAMDPQSIRLTPDIGRSLLFLPIALLLVPLQSAFEEVATRGQLMQGLIRLAPAKPYLALLLTSGIFAAMHLMNTEVQAYGAGLMLLHYFTFGAVLGAFALMDEGLELSIGIHAGNNLFSLCLVSYPESSLETPALLHQQAMSEGMDFLFMLLCVGVMYAVFFGRRPQAWRAVLENLRTGPAEPQDSHEKAG